MAAANCNCYFFCLQYFLENVEGKLNNQKTNYVNAGCHWRSSAISRGLLIVVSSNLESMMGGGCSKGIKGQLDPPLPTVAERSGNYVCGVASLQPPQPPS